MPTIYIATVSWYNWDVQEDQEKTVIFMANDFVDAMNTLVTAFKNNINEIKDFTSIGVGYVISLGHNENTNPTIEFILKENQS